MFHVSVDGSKALRVNRINSKFQLDNEEVDPVVIKLQPGSYQVMHNNKAHLIEVLSHDKNSRTFRIKVNGKITEVSVKTDLDILLEKLGMDQSSSAVMKELKAPMPGMILAIKVSEGQEIKKGDPLLILEAMKMENVIKAPGDGTVKEITVKEKQSVEKNQVLMEFGG